ncbi:MAG TPA: hypothetical protein VGC32_15000 [Solirubrobacterales bacterium]
MRPVHDPDSEAGRAEVAAGLELNRRALRLVAAARRGDLSGFGEDGTARIEVPTGEGNHKLHVTIDPDGAVLREGSTNSWSMQPEDMSSEEREDKRRRDLATEARRGKPEFVGVGYRRTVIAPPQPGAVIRVLAIEIFADGFYVDFTHNVVEQRPLGLDRGRPPFRPKPPMDVADDLGTDYYEGERANLGGGPTAFATFIFSPTPPPDATVLHITTDSGTVDLDLKG